MPGKRRGKYPISKSNTKGTVVISTTFPKKTWERLDNMRDAKGLSSVQELVRVIVGERIDAAGF